MVDDHRSNKAAAAEYIEEIAAQLAVAARRDGLQVLAYLLDMVVAEAQDRRRSLGK